MTEQTSPPAMTVSELSQQLKRKLETDFGFVRLRGELSKVKLHTSGHLYTDIKDESSVLNAVCWRGTVAQLSIKPEEGLEVICTGKITTYPARSNYQLIIETMTAAGQGALLKLLEERKKKLAAEGLFDLSRKKSLPFLPKSIGIITSPTGAVIQDMLHRIQERFPLPIILYAATVQGENTVKEVIAGLNAFHSLAPDKQPDVIIIARGGGSFEDLMPFNDEALVRAVAASQIPIISAIGHETDTTLIDYAADKRAPTPTAAAEMLTPVREELITSFQTIQQRLDHILNSRLKHDRLLLRQLSTALSDPMMIIHTQQQRIDFTTLSLNKIIDSVLAKKLNQFTAMRTALKPNSYWIQNNQQQLGHAVQRFERALVNRLEKSTQQLKHSSQLIESYSFKKTLSRGFSFVQSEHGHVIDSAEKAKQHSDMTITFHDGSIKVNHS